MPALAFLGCFTWAVLKSSYIRFVKLENSHCMKQWMVPEEPEPILSLVINKGIKSTQSDILKSIDPTTIEFQKKFQLIMKSVTNDKRHFVFVIDNLDRLPEEQALSFGVLYGASF